MTKLRLPSVKRVRNSKNAILAITNEELHSLAEFENKDVADGVLSWLKEDS